PAAEFPEGTSDVVEHFLVNRRRGPDFLFATAAAVMLRHLGYQTRLVSGFYADDGNYSASVGQLLLAKRDVHFWLEVLDVAGNWVPVEVTPGFRLRSPRIPFTYRLAQTVDSLWAWCVIRQRIWLTLAFASLVAWVLRREILDRLAT